MGYDEGDGLAVVEDGGLLEDGDVAAAGLLLEGEFGRVEGGEDGDDAFGAGGGGLVDGGDGAGGDGALDHEGVGGVLEFELGGVFGFAGDLEEAVVAGRRAGRGLRGVWLGRAGLERCRGDWF